MEEIVYDQESEIETQEKQLQKERQLAQKQKNFNDSIARLEQQACDFAVQYGPGAYQTLMLKSMCNMCYELKDQIQLLKGVSTTLTCLTEALDSIDFVMDMFSSFEDQSLQHDYGFIATIKARIKQRKAERNMTNRINMMVNRISSMTNMTVSMTNSLKRASDNIQHSMARTQKKNSDNAKKNNGGVEAPTKPTRIDQLIAERLNSNPQGPDTNTTTSSSSGSKPASSSTGSGDTSLDGIVD